MAITTNFIFNISRGASKYYYSAVENSFVMSTGSTQFTSAADSALLVVAIDAGAETDSAAKDYANLSLLLAGAANEVTNSGYARKVLTETELASVPLPEVNATDTFDLDLPDQVWTGVAAGTAWTGLVVCFRPTAAAADTAIIPISHHAFAVTPDGSDITAQIAATGYYRSN